jgi:hypothetical protein
MASFARRNYSLHGWFSAEVKTARSPTLFVKLMRGEVFCNLRYPREEKRLCHFQRLFTLVECVPHCSRLAQATMQNGVCMKIFAFSTQLSTLRDCLYMVYITSHFNKLQRTLGQTDKIRSKVQGRNSPHYHLNYTL